MRFYMIGTVLKQQGALAEAIAQFREAIGTAAVRRSAPEPRPGAESASATRQAAAVGAGRSRSAQPQNGRRAGLDVRRQRRRAEGQGAATIAARSSSSARPSASRPTTRRRTTSSRSRCGTPARGPRRRPTSTRRAASRPTSSRRTTTSHDSARCTQSGGDRGMRDGAGAPSRRLVTVAAGATGTSAAARSPVSRSPTPRVRLASRRSPCTAAPRRTSICSRPPAAASPSSTSTTTAGSISSSSTARCSKGFPAGQAPTGHLYRNRRDGTFEDVTAKSGHRPDRVGPGGVQRRLRQRRRTTICSSRTGDRTTSIATAATARSRT